MENSSYELILGDITFNESVLFSLNFEKYKQVAFSYLNHKGKHLFKEDILRRYGKDIPLSKIIDDEKDHFIPGANMKRGDKMERTFYDIQSGEEIKPRDDFFDFFFCCKLRHLDTLEINEFLSFHVDYSFDNNSQAFINFLNRMRQSQEKLDAGTFEIVKGWIAFYQKEKEQLGTEQDEKIKGRIPREPGDHLTTLNLNQTALLIQFMQQAGIILKGDYLTYTQAGKAFNLLTGYSAHTIRQQLGSKGEIEGVKFEDYKELHQILLSMAQAVSEKLPKK